jgi:hypothetical protein
MKKLLLTTILATTLIYSQHFGEGSTDQSFGLYYNSHYLNTYCLINFRSTLVGLIDDHFLNLSLSPDNALELGKDNALISTNFNGYRTSSPIVRNYVFSNCLLYDLVAFRSNFIDPGLSSITRLYIQKI